MANSKYLDNAGLTHLWGKITNYVTTSLADITASEVDWSGITNKPDLALKSDLVNVYVYKGSVATKDALPTSDNKAGDVWNTEDTGMNYGWTGTVWDPLGQILEIQSITTDEIDAIVAG